VLSTAFSRPQYLQGFVASSAMSVPNLDRVHLAAAGRAGGVGGPYGEVEAARRRWNPGQYAGQRQGEAGRKRGDDDVVDVWRGPARGGERKRGIGDADGPGQEFHR